MPLTPDQVALIQATIPILQSHGDIITRTFYSNLLQTHPSLKNIFNASHQATGHQPAALARALFAYASQIDDLGALSPAVELIAHKHASLGVKADQYGVVGEGLIGAMGQVLGDGLTEEIKEAWIAAYWQLADVLIAREGELYTTAAKDGWKSSPAADDDWREFSIKDKIKESDKIMSFYLVPKDGKPLPVFKPGQYVSVALDVPELGHRQVRQYSLSERPRTDYYRISVKRDDGLDMQRPDAPAHPGFVSNLLHAHKEAGDSVLISHPFGDFFYEATPSSGSAIDNAPLVLISAGVGLTCLMSIFNSLLSDDAHKSSTTPISWLHGARTSSARAFTTHILETAAAHQNVRAKLFLTEPGENDVQGADYHCKARLVMNGLDREEDLHLGQKETRYYVCGPTEFMVQTRTELLELGVNAGRLHLELFGTGGVPA